MKVDVKENRSISVYEKCDNGQISKSHSVRMDDDGDVALNVDGMTFFLPVEAARAIANAILATVEAKP